MPERFFGKIFWKFRTVFNFSHNTYHLSYLKPSFSLEIPRRCQSRNISLTLTAFMVKAKHSVLHQWTWCQRNKVSWWNYLILPDYGIMKYSVGLFSLLVSIRVCPDSRYKYSGFSLLFPLLYFYWKVHSRATNELILLVTLSLL